VGIGFFALVGRPWGITYGFAVWGAQAADALGLDPGSLSYWQGWRKGDLAGSLISSPTNASNLGILIGALMASGLAGRFAPVWRLSGRDLLTAIAGGLLMGYGARLAYGCNIGAYLGGMTSGSLHGLWWLIWGFLGSTIGVGLRSWLSMDPPLNPQRI
ncbi:MAG: YeeE/YedE family protein, partial [Alphaproteobacteria bacterium]